MSRQLQVLRVVLAAGRGERLGGAVKALLDLRGKTALERIARLTLPGFELRTVVVTGCRAEMVAAECRRLGLVERRNARWEDGQTGSLQVGLEAMTEDDVAFLIHPVDLPLVRQSDYDLVARAFLERAPRTGLAVATSHAMRRGHPVLFSRDVAADFMALSPGEPAHRVIRSLGAAVIHCVSENSWCVRDIDTPSDYRAAIGGEES